MDKNNQVLHPQEVLARLDDRANIEETDIDGKKRVVVHHGFKHLFEIEKFVMAIEKGWLGGFIDETTMHGKRRKLRVLYLAKQHYHKLNIWLNRYSGNAYYSERVTIFYEVCLELGFIGISTNYFGKPEEFDHRHGLRYADWFNDLIKRISQCLTTREFKERERIRRSNAMHNEENVVAMNEEMYRVRSRWVILMLTLNYEKRYQQWITLEEIQHHRDKFFRARKFNRLMSGIKNYVWTIEQGEKTGFHLHVILYYEAKHKRDVSLAQRIGEYWADTVTAGKGAYWNSNARKVFHARRGHGIGTGQIDRKDIEERESLKKNLTYLAKASQYLMIKGAEHVRTFGMGQVPQRLKHGRPRIDAHRSDDETE